MRVHLFVHEPEGKCLVADQCLIVRFGIGHRILAPPAIGQCVHNVAHVPVIVAGLLEQLDPFVRYGHAEPVIEADATFVDRTTEGRHARHILGYCDDLVVDFVQQIIGERQINDSIGVHVQAEILVVVAAEALANTARVVQHRGDAIKSVPVEVVLVVPPSQIGDQEAEHFVPGSEEISGSHCGLSFGEYI